jgi:hypothetical protein
MYIEGSKQMEGKRKRANGAQRGNTLVGKL